MHGRVVQAGHEVSTPDRRPGTEWAAGMEGVRYFVERVNGFEKFALVRSPVVVTRLRGEASFFFVGRHNKAEIVEPLRYCRDTSNLSVAGYQWYLFPIHQSPLSMWSSARTHLSPFCLPSLLVPLLVSLILSPTTVRSTQYH